MKQHKRKMEATITGETSGLESAFVMSLKFFAPELAEPVRLHKFNLPHTRHEFDFAWPNEKLAVEMEGGIFGTGRHTRSIGYHNDCDKYNIATALGWRILRFTTKHIKDDPGGMIDRVREMIEQRK